MTETDPIKRLHYFDHQFLHQQDFADEQEYHIRMRRLHNSTLHTWGVANGLTLTPAGDTRVTIGPGMAIDGLGREIVLRNSSTADPAGKSVYITIAYGEEQTDISTETSVEGNSTRWTETPVIKVNESPPADASIDLILGRVMVDGNGKITGTNDGEGANQRRTAGVTAGELAGSLRVTGDIEVTGKVDGRDVSSDGSRLDPHLRNVDTASVTNPHRTTAADVGALPITGGPVGGLTIGGFTLIRNNSPGTQALVVTVQPSGGTPTTVSGALNAVSGVDNIPGLVVRSNSANTSPPPPQNVAPSLRVDGNAVINGNLSVTGSKGNYVVDTFVNASGQRLRTGDVVRLKGTPVVRFDGLNNKIPIAEVTPADKENDSMVIGIVDRAALPDPDAPVVGTGSEDPTLIEDGGELFVVTLGTYAHCKVDASTAPISIGDLLTSSANPGHAMKATEPKIGSIIGKALEPLKEGTGYIAVFVNIQ